MVLWGNYWGLVKRASGMKRDEGECIYSPFPPCQTFFTFFPSILRPFPSFLSVPLKFSDSLGPLVEKVYS
jgi:hypothetical protein